MGSSVKKEKKIRQAARRFEAHKHRVMIKILPDSQKQALETLTLQKVSSASWCDRHAYEGLVKKGLAIKHSNGRQCTYSLA